jgi:hypothetical protein
MNAESEKYRALWAMVLVTAIRDMDHAAEEIRRDARRFIFDTDERAVSMRWVCSMTGIDAEALQARCMSRESRRRIALKKH